MIRACKCPQCKQFILGDYCYSCKINIYDVIYQNKDATDFSHILKELFPQQYKTKGKK